MLQTAPAHEPHSLQNTNYLGFFQPLDFFSQERDRIILLLVLESWESLKNSFKLLVIYHSEPNLEKLHSKACYFPRS